MYDELKKKQVEVFYKTHNMNAGQVARHFGMPYTTLKAWVEKGNWIAGEAINDIEIDEETINKNLDAVAKCAQEDIKKQIARNLGGDAFSLDSVVLQTLLNESSEAILLQVMSLNHINRTMAQNAALAKKALIDLQLMDNGAPQSKMAIIGAAERVNKMYLDLKETLYGKDITQTNGGNVMDYSQLNDAELLEIIHKNEADSENPESVELDLDMKTNKEEN